MQNPQYWQAWTGPTGTTGVSFLGVTGAVTGPAFFGVTGATAPTGPTGPFEDNVRYLYSRVRAQLVGASDAAVRMAMFDMFHEFFNDSSIWKEVIPGNILPSVLLYQLVAGGAQDFFDIDPVGKIIRLLGVADANYVPIPADMPEPPIMRLAYPPSMVTSVWAAVIKNVDTPVTVSALPEVPYHIVQTYLPYLLRGVLGLMQQQKDKPYTDAKMATLNYQSFRQGVNMARTNALRNNLFGSNAWRFPQAFRTRTQKGGISVGSNFREF